MRERFETAILFSHVKVIKDYRLARLLVTIFGLY